MHRYQVRRWLEGHPGSVSGDADLLLDRCEQDVRRHAEEDAWAHALAIVRRESRRWNHSFSLPASEAFAGCEVCHALARRIRLQEPHPSQEDEAGWTDSEIWRALAPEAREVIASWLHDLALETEHDVWRGIVRFVDKRGNGLVREGRLSRQLSWDLDHGYASAASRVTEILAREMEAHTHPARDPLHD